MPPTTEGHVEVVAHRGASHERPEHTEEAYVLAIEQGADALECDVRLTADGHLVCHHDPVLDRTSSGRGRLSGRTLAQLRELDWDSPAGGPLTLERLFELRRRRRPPGRAGGGDQAPGALRRRGGAPGRRPRRPVRLGAPGSPVRVMSFSLAAVAPGARFAPDLTTVPARRRRPAVGRFARPATCRPACRSSAPVSTCCASAPRWVEQVREAVHALHVWTVDTPEGVETACLAAGAVAVITDRPQDVLAVPVAASTARGARA